MQRFSAKRLLRFTEEYGSTSSIYELGEKAKNAIEIARTKISKAINCMPEEIYWYLIPIYNTTQCMNGVFSMDYQMLPVIITCVANVVYSGVLVVVLTKMFGSERIMYT